MVNGEKPVDIDVIAGMDQDINNEFTEFLKKSMIQGTGLPPALLEAADNIEFAKQISAQNANFCRRIVRYQKLLTNPFEELIRVLYKFEHQYNLDGSDQIDDININDITIKFPSPGSLNLTNLIDLFTQFDTVSDYITKRFIPDKMDQSNVDEQAAFKMEVMQKVLPQIEWDEYKELYEAFKDKFDEKQLIQKANMPPIDPDDPYGGQQY